MQLSLSSQPTSVLMLFHDKQYGGQKRLEKELKPVRKSSV